jgi:branched-chain amino acid transport system permease protein
MASVAAESPPLAARRRMTSGGVMARVAVAGGLALVVLLLPLGLQDFQNQQITRAPIYAVIGLSLNVLMGHLGQISLGHQAFVGLGAFVSGNVATNLGLSLYIALPIAGLFGAFSALLLGLVALRLKGLYLALITLAYGAVAEESLFNIRALTRGGEGMPAPRPPQFQSDRAYLYLCFIVLSLVLLLDWRLVKTKAGRAIMAIRHDERVAATLGVNVTFYKTFAFMLAGFLAGVAGSLFAHWQETVVSNDFVLEVAFTWVFMTVVGGLGSRAGVVVGAAFFALFPFIVESLGFIPETWKDDLPRAVPLIGALLLVLTLVLYPGGIGQQLLPLRRWLAGGPFLEHKKERKRKKAKAVAATAPVPAGLVEAPIEDEPLEKEPDRADQADTEQDGVGSTPNGPPGSAEDTPAAGDGQPAKPKRRLLRRGGRKKGG